MVFLLCTAFQDMRYSSLRGSPISAGVAALKVIVNACYSIRMVTLGQMSCSPHSMLISQLEYAFLWTAARPIPVHVGGP